MPASVHPHGAQQYDALGADRWVVQGRTVLRRAVAGVGLRPLGLTPALWRTACPGQAVWDMTPCPPLWPHKTPPPRRDEVTASPSGAGKAGLKSAPHP